jgi:leader peptidase (prepilin peptidase)/N-methyltransferase
VRTPDWAEPVTRRPLQVTVAALAVLALVGWRLGPVAALPAFAYLVIAGVALAHIDVALHRLPDPITLPSYIAGASLLALAAPFTEHGGTRFEHALFGMAGLFLLYAAQWFAVPSQIGLGDVKLAGVLGLYLGWLGLAAWILGVCAGFVLAAAYSVALLLARRATLRSSIPFGPFMLTGALVAVLAHG